jgi:hypothetical protein
VFNVFPSRCSVSSIFEEEQRKPIYVTFFIYFLYSYLFLFNTLLASLLFSLRKTKRTLIDRISCSRRWSAWSCLSFCFVYYSSLWSMQTVAASGPKSDSSAYEPLALYSKKVGALFEFNIMCSHTLQHQRSNWDGMAMAQGRER